MDNKIDLDAIIDIKYETSFGRAEVYKFMKEAIHQALVLVKKRGKVIVHPETEIDDMNHAKQYIDYMTIDGESINNIEKLIV